MQLHRPEVLSKIAAQDARTIVVSMAGVAELKAWVPFFAETFLKPALEKAPTAEIIDPLTRTSFTADPARSVYRTYGLGRHALREVYGFKFLVQYALWAAQGKPIRNNLQDKLQRGGNFVVGRDGRLTMSHIGRNQSDRPRMEQILTALI